jgi:hypothetical protein
LFKIFLHELQRKQAYSSTTIFRKREAYRVWYEKLKEENLLQDIDIDGDNIK